MAKKKQNRRRVSRRLQKEKKPTKSKRKLSLRRNQKCLLPLVHSNFRSFSIRNWLGLFSEFLACLNRSNLKSSFEKCALTRKCLSSECFRDTKALLSLPVALSSPPPPCTDTGDVVRGVKPEDFDFGFGFGFGFGVGFDVEGLCWIHVFLRDWILFQDKFTFGPNQRFAKFCEKHKGFHWSVLFKVLLERRVVQAGLEFCVALVGSSLEKKRKGSKENTKDNTKNNTKDTKDVHRTKPETHKTTQEHTNTGAKTKTGNKTSENQIFSSKNDDRDKAVENDDRDKAVEKKIKKAELLFFLELGCCLLLEQDLVSTFKDDFLSHMEGNVASFYFEQHEFFKLGNLWKKNQKMERKLNMFELSNSQILEASSGRQRRYMLEMQVCESLQHSNCCWSWELDHQTKNEEHLWVAQSEALAVKVFLGLEKDQDWICGFQYKLHDIHSTGPKGEMEGVRIDKSGIKRFVRLRFFKYGYFSDRLDQSLLLPESEKNHQMQQQQQQGQPQQPQQQEEETRQKEKAARKKKQDLFPELQQRLATFLSWEDAFVRTDKIHEFATDLIHEEVSCYFRACWKYRGEKTKNRKMEEEGKKAVRSKPQKSIFTMEESASCDTNDKICPHFLDIVDMETHISRRRLVDLQACLHSYRQSEARQFRYAFYATSISESDRIVCEGFSLFRHQHPHSHSNFSSRQHALAHPSWLDQSCQGLCFANCPQDAIRVAQNTLLTGDEEGIVGEFGIWLCLIYVGIPLKHEAEWKEERHPFQSTFSFPKTQVTKKDSGCDQIDKEIVLESFEINQDGGYIVIRDGRCALPLVKMICSFNKK